MYIVYDTKQMINIQNSGSQSFHKMKISYFPDNKTLNFHV